MATTFTSRAEDTPVRIPPTMRAAVYRGIDDVRVETVPVPSIGAGEVLIRVVACGICGTDLKKIHTGSHSAPRIFGHETAGTIVALGAGVEDFAIGARVMVFHHVPCGDCYYCRKKTFAQCPSYKRVGCTAGFEPAGGGFAEYVHVKDWIVRRGLIKIPDGVPFEQAAFVEPVNTCLKAVKNLSISSDETVLVIGQGPIGIILAVGGNALIQTAIDAARPGGRILLFAQTQHGSVSIDPAVICMDEKTLLGSYSSSASIQDEGADLVFNGYSNGFDLTRLISHRYPLEDAVKAIEVASNPSASSMKVFIEAGAAES